MLDDDDYIDEINEQDLEFEDLFYQSNKLNDCILKKQEYNTFYKGSCDSTLLKDHSTNECIITFNGSKKRTWQESIGEIDDIMSNLRCKLRFDENRTTSKLDIVQLFYGWNSSLYFIFRDRMGWSYDIFLLFFNLL